MVRIMNSISFWKNVKIQDIHECWIWLASSRNKDGYGNIKIKGKTNYSHRVAYELFYNTKIPDNLLVCHSCDNPKCVNPNHLFLGSAALNNYDKKIKKTWKNFKTSW